MNTTQIKFYCPHCDQALKCLLEHSGRQVQCPGCKEFIRVPSAAGRSGLTEVEPRAARAWDTKAWGG